MTTWNSDSPHLIGAVDGLAHLDITDALSTLGEAITRALHDTALAQTATGPDGASRQKHTARPHTCGVATDAREAVVGSIADAVINAPETISLRAPAMVAGTHAPHR